jgi:hypothetical protein
MFAALISAKTAKQTEVLSGVKQTTKVMGSSRGERLAPLRTDDVANSAQNQPCNSVCSQRFAVEAQSTILDGMGLRSCSTRKNERGGHDGDQ